MKIPVAKLLGGATAISTVLCVGLVAPRESVHRYTLIHWPSAALVLGGTLGLLLVWQPVVRWRGFIAFVNQRSSHTKRPRTVLQRRALAEFLTAGGRAALCAGLGGELLGVVMILTSDTSPTAMEPGISVATVSLIYGLLLSELVFRPLRKMAVPDMAIGGLGSEAASGLEKTPHRYSSPSMSTSSSGDNSVGSPV